MAQAEHQQPVVMLAAIAHQLAADEHRHLLPFDRAFEGDVAQPLHAEVQRRLPRLAEFASGWMTAQPVTPLERHVARRRRAADRSVVGERRDERALPLGRPPVMAIAHRHGREVWNGLAAVGRSGLSVLHANHE